MTFRLLVLAPLALAAGCAQHAVKPAPAEPAPVAVSTATDNLNATLWAQRSLEHDLVYREVYAQATRQVAAALAQPDWDALPKTERKTPAAGLPPAVIVDVDETVLDNSPYQARLIRDGQEYDEFTWDAWCREKAARATPGALEFARDAAARGVTVFYLTNRAQHLNAVTLENLKSVGFPVSERENAFLGLGLVVPDCESNGSDKGCRRELIGRTHRVLALVGDQLGDFIDVENNSPAAREAAAAPYAAWFGERWFMLPNPTYGSWDGAVLGNERGAPPETKRRLRREALRYE
ncbi:MAG TPA: HAD family acid phosphatase [Tahibacter sp.]|nr:HAD family acid phosphatase [Tahibacter sp.]